MATIKPEGIITFNRNAKAPEFVLGTIVIDVDKFQQWIDSHNGYLTEYNGKQQLKLQVLKSSNDRGFYLAVDNYTKKDNF